MARLKPYVGKNHEGDPKFKLDRNAPKKPTKADKLEIKSANRSRKKGARRDAKKEIQEKLELMNKICPSCKKGTLIIIKEDLPWNIEHYQCDYCDGTYVKEEIDGRID